MRFLVVDDHPLIQQALATVLAGLDPAAQVVAVGDCEAGFRSVALGPEPDLLLLDLNLPGMSGLEALRSWRGRWPGLPVVVLSATQDGATVRAVLAAGAAGFIPKSMPAALMADALRLVLGGGRYLPPELLAPSAAEPPRLTERQLEVVRLVARGAPNKIIGRELGLAERTVKAHVTALMRLLRVSSRTQLALAAARLGLEER